MQLYRDMSRQDGKTARRQVRVEKSRSREVEKSKSRGGENATSGDDACAIMSLQLADWPSCRLRTMAQMTEATMATAVRRFTYADLADLPTEREGDRHELFEGELVVTPAPMPRHQKIVGNLYAAMRAANQAASAGDVFLGPIDVRLTPDIVLEPDLCFVAAERLHIVGPKTIDAAPDLVVEVLSPGTRERDLGAKRALYARFGVQEYWIVDPDARTVSVFALRGDRFAPRPLGEEGQARSGVLPDLVVAPVDVFAGV
jgi:Uma2 family endonuclease